jgi:hypothetical protein
MDAITKATGSTVLSCEHAFHFRCIDEWFTKQLLDNLHQTCPCCRSEGAELDRCMYEELEDEDEDDETYADDDEESEDADSVLEEMTSDERDLLSDLVSDIHDLLWERRGEGSWIVTSRQELAYQGLRSLFGEMNDLDADPVVLNNAAQKIQAIVRGHQVRRVYGAAFTLLRIFN